MVSRSWSAVLAGLILVVLPSTVLGQSGAIAGVVRDATGSVLPGVTVEAASPALIEKTRTAVTDDQGQYRVLDLRPGVYAVTFTLSGFATIVRTGIEVSVGGTVNLVAELRVSAVEETITVTGQTPLVDVQNVTQHAVLTQEVLEAIPANRAIMAAAAFIPSITFSSSTSLTGRDVGGSAAEATNIAVAAGSRASDTPTLVDGMRTNNLQGSSGGGRTNMTTNPGMTQEVVVDTAGHSVEALASGARINAIPKDGANTFRGSVFATFANGDMQGNNITPDLVAQGVAGQPGLDKMYDFNATLGGPIVENRLWFVGSVRRNYINEFVPGLFLDSAPLDNYYTPDLNRPGTSDGIYPSYDVRFTWQAAEKHKFAFSGSYQHAKRGGWNASSIVAWEAAQRLEFPNTYFTQATYNAPLSSRFLIEAGLTVAPQENLQGRREGQPSSLISIQELSTGLLYRTQASSRNPIYLQSNERFKVSYVTGSHTFKVGFQGIHGTVKNVFESNDSDVNLQVLNGVPRQVVVWATPYETNETLKYDLGLFAEDQWTIDRLTVSGGIRVDIVNSSVPEQHVPPVRYVGARDFGPVDNVPSWRDISPRLGASFDLFGDGRTAVKASVGKYVESMGVGLAAANNPMNRIVTNTTRSWIDLNGDFLPQENEMGPPANQRFGQLDLSAQTFDPEYLRGWGKRAYNWEIQGSVQQQLRPGVSLAVDYTHRWFKNLRVTDNLAVAASDYSPFCVTAPADPRLPGGGGNQICGYYDVNPDKFGQVQNFVTLAKNYGEVTEVFDGIGTALNIRLRERITLSGGTYTSRSRQDICGVVALVDNAPGVLGGEIGANAGNPSLVASPSSLFCNITPPLQTTAKFYAIVPLPWWGISTSYSFQSQPGPQITASYTATNAEIAPSLGRLLSGGRTVTTVPLVAPGTMYGERVNQFDIRVTKRFSAGQLRFQPSIDLYNLFNVNPVLRLNNTYGPAWLRPLAIMPARFIKVSAQIDF